MKSIKIILLLLLMNLNNATAQYYPIIRKHYTPEKLLSILNDYHFTNAHFSYKSISPKTSINDSVKNQLLSLLRHEWTDAELEKKAGSYFREQFENMYFNRIRGNAYLITEAIYSKRSEAIYKKSKQDTAATVTKQYHQIYDSVYWALNDSLGLLYKKELVNKLKESPVSDDIVLAAAFAQLKEAIPILKNDLLAKGKHYISPAVAELALARLGDTASINKLIKQHFAYPKTNDAFLKFDYYQSDCKALETIGTQESISLLSNWLDTTLKFFDNQHSRWIYLSAYVVFDIREFIQNKSFHEGFAKIPQSPYLNNDYESATAEVIMYVKNWMIVNKGKYEFD